MIGGAQSLCRKFSQKSGGGDTGISAACGIGILNASDHLPPSCTMVRLRFSVPTDFTQIVESKSGNSIVEPT